MPRRSGWGFFARSVLLLCACCAWLAATVVAGSGDYCHATFFGVTGIAFQVYHATTEP
jgi:hypothetical protein